MKLRTKICEHLKGFEASSIKKSNGYECEECIKTGDHWVHLRTCQKCGVTLCCDSSPNKHASRHYQNHKDHPVVVSAEPRERWAWCYEHKSFMNY